MYTVLMKMAVTRLSLAVMLVFAFCAFNKVYSTTILVDSKYEKVNMLITNDLNQSVTIEGPGLQYIEIRKSRKMSLEFEGSGTVTVKEDGKVILKTEVGNDRLNLVRTHSKANLTEVLGDISISQKADQLDLTLRGSAEKKHTFVLSEGDSISEQMMTFDDNSISIKQGSDQINQNLTFQGFFEYFIFTQDEAGHNQSISFVGDGLHSTSLHKDKGITTVSRIWYAK